MAKKKRGKAPPPAKKKKKKKLNPVALLMQEHPHLEKDKAKEIIESGLSYEEWGAEQERIKEERKHANEQRVVQMICAQYSTINEEEALEIVKTGITPEDFIQKRREEVQAKLKAKERARRQAKFTGKSKGRAPGKFKGKKRPRKPSGPSKKELRSAKVDEVMKQYPDLPRPVAGQIASGNLNYEDWIAKQALRGTKRKSSRTEEEKQAAKEKIAQRQKELEARIQAESKLGKEGDAYLQEAIDKEIEMLVYRFHKPTFDGIFFDFEPFRIHIQQSTHKCYLVKRFCSFLVEKEEQALVEKQLQILMEQYKLKQFPYHDPKKRYQIPEELLAEGNGVSVLTHDGIYLAGKVLWNDRFQFLLGFPEGGQALVFKHAIHQAYSGDEQSEGEFLPYEEFQAKKAALLPEFPTELPVESIEVPIHFDDFDVKDKIYQDYLQNFEDGTYEIVPISVRREGGFYVLVDGYRRLILAKEKGIETIPVSFT